MLNHKTTNIFFGILLIGLLVLGLFIKLPWSVFLLVLGVRFLVLVIGSSFIQLQFHVRAFCENKSTKEKIIALTFDDGPSSFSLQILECLKKHQAKATFFCIGKNIENHPEILKQMVEEGHTIGNHSYSHSPFFDFYSKDKIIQEIHQTNALIKKHTGIETTIFRPPYGVTNPSIARALVVTKHQVIGWNIRSMDGISKNEKQIYNRIIKRVSPGGIILMHDTSISSVRVLEQLLLFLSREKYKVVSIEDLLGIQTHQVE